MESSIITSVFLPAALSIIMLGMGLSLVIDDFKRIALYPKAALIGMTNQLLLVPLFGFIFATLFPLKPELAVGIMIIAACPGGPTSNLITYLSRGDAALSISLTAVSSVITIFTIPFIINFSMIHFMNKGEVIQLDIFSFLKILAITVIPVSLGMYILAKKSDLANRMSKPVKIASAVLLFLIIAGTVITERANLVPFFRQTGLPVLGLNVTTMLFGFFSARLLKLNQPQTVTISIESGIQNGTLGIFIASSILSNSEMAIPPAIYSLVMFLSGGMMIYAFGRRREKIILG